MDCDIYITSTPPSPSPHTTYTHTPSSIYPIHPLYGVAIKEVIIFYMWVCGRAETTGGVLIAISPMTRKFDQLYIYITIHLSAM